MKTATRFNASKTEISVSARSSSMKQYRKLSKKQIEDTGEPANRVSIKKAAGLNGKSKGAWSSPKGRKILKWIEKAINNRTNIGRVKKAFDRSRDAEKVIKRKINAYGCVYISGKKYFISKALFKQTVSIFGNIAKDRNGKTYSLSEVLC
jgi:hypothetical protein